MKQPSRQTSRPSVDDDIFRLVADLFSFTFLFVSCGVEMTQAESQTVSRPLIKEKKTVETRDSFVSQVKYQARVEAAAMFLPDRGTGEKIKAQSST